MNFALFAIGNGLEWNILCLLSSIMISIIISNGASVQVAWYQGMNAQNALEESYPSITFGVTYYGSTYKYYVVMINTIYDDPNSGMYWEFLLNGVSSNYGIDSVSLKDGDTIAFNNVSYNEKIHKGTSVEIKHLEAMKN